MVKLKTTWLVTNYTCDNHCDWCYAEDNECDKNIIMPKQLAFESIDFLDSLDVKKIILIGGEPTVYPHIIDTLRYAKSKDINIGMVSNGRTLKNKEYLEQLFDAGLGGASISIQGSNPGVHDSITNVGGSFDDSVRGIKNYGELKTPISTSTTMCEKNVEDLENIVGFLSDLGVEKIGFTTCTNSPGSNQNNDIISPTRAAKLIEKLYTHGKERSVEVRSITPLPLCNVDEKIREEMLEKGVLNYSCQMYRGSGLAIDPTGNILPCVHWSNYPIGNIKKENKLLTPDEFNDFWFNENKLPSRLRKELWKYPSVKCKKDSKYWGECIGGCPTFWSDFTPDLEIKGLP